MGPQSDDMRRVRAYRQTFVDSEYGMIVLVDILNDLGFFSMSPGAVDQNPEVEQAFSAYARTLLHKLGIWRAENSEEIVKAIAGLRPMYAPEEEIDDE